VGKFSSADDSASTISSLDDIMRGRNHSLTGSTSYETTTPSTRYLVNHTSLVLFVSMSATKFYYNGGVIKEELTPQGQTRT